MPLTDRDVARLVRFTGQRAVRLVEWLRPDEVDMVGEPETFVELPEGRRLMVLSWRDGGCSLLAANDCGVHPARPLSCRLYPFDVTLGRKGGIRRLRLLDVTDCAYELGAAHASRDVARLAAAERRELSAYAARVLDFNRLQKRRRMLGKSLLSAVQFLDRLLPVPRQSRGSLAGKSTYAGSLATPRPRSSGVST